jgi:hypothetical protein
MSDVATQVPANPDSAVQQPVQNDNNSDVNQMLASALWDGAVPKQPDAPAAAAPQVPAEPPADAASTPPPADTPADDVEMLSVD